MDDVIVQNLVKKFKFVSNLKTPNFEFCLTTPITVYYNYFFFSKNNSHPSKGKSINIVNFFFILNQKYAF